MHTLVRLTTPGPAIDSHTCSQNTIHHNHHTPHHPKTGCRLHDNLCSVVHRCPPHCFLVLFSQASSNTRKARSCTGSNEPFSHIDQPLPDPISPWTCSAIEAACPFIPTHTLHPHLPTPVSLCSRPPLPVYSLPGRRVCITEIKQGEGEQARGRECHWP